MVFKKCTIFSVNEGYEDQMMLKIKAQKIEEAYNRLQKDGGRNIFHSSTYENLCAEMQRNVILHRTHSLMESMLR